VAWRFPPLNSLRAFEAAGRCKSFTLAAEELHVTPGAVSRQIKALEEKLGVSLFARNNREVRLTPDSKQYLDSLTEAFRRIDKSTSDLLDSRREKPLRIMCSMIVAARWLFPRLPRFLALHPNRHVSLTTALTPSTSPIDTDVTDLVIRLGTGDWPSHIRSHLLLPSEQIVVCSPKLLERGPPLRNVADLKSHTLLYSSLRPHAWPRWFETAGIKSADLSNSIAFETSALAYEAAVEGMGVALGEIVLISEDVRKGRLIAPFKIYQPNPESFYLLYPKKIEAVPALKEFCVWILDEAAKNASEAKMFRDVA
jgi:LysR family transcriptional regulator, glycine cleavage system transcriptional activator